MSSNSSFYSLPQDDDLFSLSFTQQNIPMLSHSQSSVEESPLSSYQDDLSFNKNYHFAGYEQPITPIQFNNNKTNNYNYNYNNDDDDLIFELDNEFVSNTSNQKSNLNTENNLFTKQQPQQDIFANAAQQNYRLWLSSV